MKTNKPLIETWTKLVSENENNVLVYSIQKIKEDQDGNVIREFKPTLYDMELTNNMSLRDSIEDLVSGFSTEFDEEDTIGIRDFVQDVSGEIFFGSPQIQQKEVLTNIS